MANSNIRKSYKFRISPNKTVTAKLCLTLDLCRELYNAGLQERRDAWRMNRVNISYIDQQNQLPELKKIRTDLQDVYSQVLRETLKQLDRGFAHFFRRVKLGQTPGFPRFKSVDRFNSFCYPEAGTQGVKFDGLKIFLSKIGWVPVRLSRQIEGRIRSVVVKREGFKWFVIFHCDHIPSQPLMLTGESVGIDMGLESFATLSDGTQIDNWRYFQSAQKKLRVAQRRVARRVRGSNRRKKAVAALRAIHQKVFNQRQDFQHKLSTDLIKKYDLIAIEKLNILGMSKGVLSKQILDASWGGFFHKLSYKAESADKKVVEINPNFTSQECSQCKNRVKKDLRVRVHNCTQCGLILHRDHNAALNILALGLSVQALTCPVTESVA